jgi:UDP-glucuronate 4-epimerase
MKVLVTGAAGFIGSHVIARLLELNHTVLGLDRRTFGDSLEGDANLAVNWAKMESYAQANLTMVTHLSRLPKEWKPDAIIHLAAQAGVRPSVEDPSATYENNVLSTSNLLEWAEARGVKRVVFASSSSVYGGLTGCYENQGADVQRSPYGASKRMGELALQTHALLHNASCVALRFFTVYGPRQRCDLAIRKFAERMLAGMSIEMYGDGTTTRDYTYITDIVDGIVSALEYTERMKGCDIINLGGGEPVSLKDMVRALENALGLKARIRYMEPQPGDVRDTAANNTVAKATLGYEPKVKFKEGIKLFAEWIQKEVQS